MTAALCAAVFAACAFASPVFAQPDDDKMPDGDDPEMTEIKSYTHESAEIMMTALTLLGVKYRFGGDSASGVDCSGLVRLVFREAWGKTMPRTAAEIAQASKKISVEELQPGDLVFYNTRRRAFSHVGIYLGDGRFIHAPSKGKRVKIENMSGPYWSKRFDGARRVDRDPVKPGE